jgi:hypothetical protein
MDQRPRVLMFRDGLTGLDALVRVRCLAGREADVAGLQSGQGIRGRDPGCRRGGIAG